MERIHMEDLPEQEVTEKEEKEVKGGSTFLRPTSPTLTGAAASIPTLSPTTPLSGKSRGGLHAGGRGAHASEALTGRSSGPHFEAVPRDSRSRWSIDYWT